MNPQPTTQLDPQVVNLAKAIRAIETKGQKDPYTARGGSGEYGAYQFTPGTWEKASTKYLGKAIPLEGSTREQQNEVAYKQLKEFKDQGLNVGQIASIWNSGKADAYLDPNYKGVNQYGIRYDVPQYAKSVAETYHSIQKDGEPSIVPVTASSVGYEQKVAPAQGDPNKGFLGTKKDDSLYGKVIDNSITRGISSFFPGRKIGEAIGTLGGFAYTKAADAIKGTDEAKNYDLSAPTPLQTTGDAAAALLTTVSGLPGKAVSVFGKSVPLLTTAASKTGRILQTGALGGAFGATNAIAEGEKDIKDIGKNAFYGGLTGAGLGIGAEAVQGLARWLPARLAGSFIKTPANEETVKYAVNKGLSSPQNMLRDSDKSIGTLGRQLDKVLNSPEYSKIRVSGPKILDNVLAQYPDSGMTRLDLVSNLKRVAPLKSKAIDRLLQGDFTLKEIHTLNSAIGRNTFKMAFDDPAVKAGKELGNAVYQNISSIIKKTAKETVPLFDDLSKEYALNTALDRAIKRGVHRKLLTLKDLIAFATLSVVHPIAGVGGAAFTSAMENPSVNLRAAGLLSKFGGKNSEALKQGLKAPVLNATGGLIQKVRGGGEDQ